MLSIIFENGHTDCDTFIAYVCPRVIVGTGNELRGNIL